MNRISVFVFAAFMIGCGGPVAETESYSVTIMTFNVENLFDNEDDPGKNDETYLALTD